ncbi:MAG: hypothetical protein U1E39_15775 [Planctomycetota bacterium]
MTSHRRARRPIWTARTPSLGFASLALLLFVAVPLARADGAGPTAPWKPTVDDARLKVAPEWERAYAQKLRIDAAWDRLPGDARVRLDAEYVALETRGRSLIDRAVALLARIDAQAEAVAAFQAREAAFQQDVAAFNERCEAPSDDDALTRCRAERDALVARQESLTAERERLVAQAATLQAELAAHNATSRAWAEGPVTAFSAAAEEALAAAARPLSGDERARLEADLARERERVQGLQEALRRLAKQHETAERDRTTWEASWRDAEARAEQRVIEFAADKTVERLGGRLVAHRKGVQADILRTLDERVNVAGGNAADKAARLAALDARLKALYDDRAVLGSTIESLDGAKLRLQQTLAGAQAATAEERSEQVEAAGEVLNALLADPKVQAALKLAGVYGDLLTYGKLATDAAFDLASELTAWRRIRGLDEQADRYLADVKRLDGELKAAVARIQELRRRLEAPPSPG